jgi:polysaccharide pyruvyl transferase WcaK-like protein
VKKYLIVGVSLRSRGGEAMVFEACKKITEIDKDNEISMVTPNFNYDSNFLQKVSNPYGIKVYAPISAKHCKIKYINIGLGAVYLLYDIVSAILNTKLLKYFGLKINYRGELSQRIAKTDVIIEIAGISFSENFGVSSAWSRFIRMLLSKVMEKKYFCLPQSYGPSNNIFINIFAKLGLNCTTYIMPRGKKSLEYLDKLHLRKKNITFVPDLAFSYNDPIKIENERIYARLGINASQRYVGIMTNSNLYRWDETRMMEIFPRVIDHLVGNLNYTVILIPHEVNDIDIVDDQFVNNLIYKNSDHKRNILNIADDLRANEVKSLIKLCDLTVCSRFHGVISSLKMEIPPVVVGWADKYYELMELLGLEDLVMDYRIADNQSIISRIDYVLANRTAIIEKINKNLHNFRNSSEIVKHIIEQNL